MIIIFCDSSFTHAVGIINVNVQCDHFGRKQYQIFGDKNIHDTRGSNIYAKFNSGDDDEIRKERLLQKFFH